jgi:hypothetical protein
MSDQQSDQRDLIVAVDPGYTSGCVLGAYAERDPLGFTFIAANEIEWHTRARFFTAFLGAHAPRIRAIVIERFYLFSFPDAVKNQVGSEMPAPRVIGLVEGIAEVFELSDRIVVQETYAKKVLRRVPAVRDIT